MQLRLLRVFEMTPLSERQQKAEALTREIHQLGGWVVNPMPLAIGEKLRFQFLAGERCEAALDRLRDLGFEPQFRNAGLRFCISGIAEPCNTYEIQIEGDRIPIHDDRTIRGEIAQPKKTDVELQGMRKYLGLEVKK